ncbi:aspartate carbamoyltransferase catalytic subunit [Candidatus Solincola tengchongensis]|uniref:aspartate carbamoyltransferase catalytic subunit n=1 Tax=Candidatus Solincola tengchongensis TaxID=2900693 RepID=UPI00257F953B|nr:aspartate carbamoyltransferase catalytic subunit [Candidatus Solincola tengchongensis]
MTVDAAERRHLLDVDDLTREDMERILETARSFSEVMRRPIKKVPSLRGKTVVNLFYEPSTRTRLSFEVAAKRLSADVLNFAASTSSVEKGESLKDTALTLRAMGVDAVVIRHPVSGAPWLLRRWLDVTVLNAGDGMHAHPTQALLDLFTMRERLGDLEGRTIAYVGDILHSRVARSGFKACLAMGMKVVAVAPPTLLPPLLPEGVEVSYDLDEVIPHCDVLYMLRVQKERLLEGRFPSPQEYARYYQLNNERLRAAGPGVVVMHPGPMNRGMEISSEVADAPHAAITAQVAAGVAVRMAVLFLLLGPGERGD